MGATKRNEGRQMTAYVIFDVDIHDATRYQDFMTQVKPALLEAGGVTGVTAGS
jgi:uncharacterized protein (DUF1330 family)